MANLFSTSLGCVTSVSHIHGMCSLYFPRPWDVLPLYPTSLVCVPSIFHVPVMCSPYFPCPWDVFPLFSTSLVCVPSITHVPVMCPPYFPCPWTAHTSLNVPKSQYRKTFVHDIKKSTLVHLHICVMCFPKAPYISPE